MVKILIDEESNMDFIAEAMDDITGNHNMCWELSDAKLSHDLRTKRLDVKYFKVINFHHIFD